jgi:hypothetical protein
MVSTGNRDIRHKAENNKTTKILQRPYQQQQG